MVLWKKAYYQKPAVKDNDHHKTFLQSQTESFQGLPENANKRSLMRKLLRQGRQCS